MIGLLLACLCAGMPPSCALAAGGCRVLVVMSYEEDYPWVKQQKEGIDSQLGGVCEVKYFYLNTKRNFAGGGERSKEAYALYRSFRPDGVIAADDDAQAMFVVPYLRDKVKTPVMFCGVNAEPEQYGYPASNVSGVLERHHIAESIVLARQLIPSVKTIGFIMKESPVAGLVRNQVNQEYASYPIRVVGFKMPKTLMEAVAMAREFRKSADVLYVETLEGIVDAAGSPIKDREAMSTVARAFGKATLTGNSYYIEYGLLAAVVLSGQEQGATVARMLQQAMGGTPVARIPVVKNHSGKRMINVTVMKKLGITPKPLVLRGVELVRTKEP
ncbi:ABC transporter substrate-binding protein [Geobacter sp. FeAm09]|uniref:ABC transporter substrate-binding protein n=1 Tax=Geobacter sp. FeAm09 TaxID=2597769 RepID=UPI00197AE5E3|nr:ABC transporter substrate binding protein [Geobacter sp. FeAm09]